MQPLEKNGARPCPSLPHKIGVPRAVRVPAATIDLWVTNRSLGQTRLEPPRLQSAILRPVSGGLIKTNNTNTNTLTTMTRTSTRLSPNLRLYLDEGHHQHNHHHHHHHTEVL